MCKIVYQLTGAISPLFFKGYVKLDDLKKLEWNNRGFSTLHALLVAAASLYLLLESDLFHNGARDDLMINRTSAFSDTILGISTGWLLSGRLGNDFLLLPSLGWNGLVNCTSCSGMAESLLVLENRKGFEKG
ncbi:putative transmembrane protein 56-B-like isoform 2 [Capsicum annuum]|nr:putative transmembrane protein 56-B-like isoform 2 [Capsicum annuum]